MKLKKLVKVMLVSCSILALGACSSMHHRNGYGAGDNMNGGAGPGVQASGVGQGDEFSNQGSSRVTAQGAQKGTYYFDFDKSDVHDEDKPAIYAHADHLVAHPKSKIILEGHTDPRGSREYNIALGERRANAVSELMASKGVNPNQIRVVSYGAERLAEPGHDEEAYRLDRRAVITHQQN